MNNTELAVLQLRINLIEELLCRDLEFRKPYIEALSLIASIAEDQQQDNSEDFVSAIKNLMARINKTPA